MCSFNTNKNTKKFKNNYIQNILKAKLKKISKTPKILIFTKFQTFQKYIK